MIFIRKTSRSLTVEGQVQMSMMAAEGFSSQQVANEVGCSQGAVIKILRNRKQTGLLVYKGRSGQVDIYARTAYFDYCL